MLTTCQCKSEDSTHAVHTTHCTTGASGECDTVHGNKGLFLIQVVRRADEVLKLLLIKEGKNLG